MHKEVIIIGGGVAGLCAAIRLTELGKQPLLIEGGSYPSHKVCGEFLSPECIPILNGWGISPILIPQSTLRTPTRVLDFNFSKAAGSLSHFQLDPLLARRAETNGADIRTNTQVKSIRSHQSKGHEIELLSGEIFSTSSLIIATGRIPSYTTHPLIPVYMGIKTHFNDLQIGNKLEMFSFAGTYLGISPVEEKSYNVACLAHYEIFQKFDSAENFIQHLMEQNVLLRNYLSNGKNLFGNWLIAPIPAFGIKSTPNWPHAYFIGDSAVTIPPASGSGLAMAIIGGYMAAEYLIKQRPVEFKRMWRSRCSWQLRWAKLLHRILLQPNIGNPLFRIATTFPSIAQHVFRHTRQATL